MPAKLFRFSVVCMRSGALWEFGAEHATLDGAFRIGLASVPVLFVAKQQGPSPSSQQGWDRMFRFRFENGRTGEFSAAIGQGEDVAAAWADVLKGTRETFRPKNDGKARDAIGLTVLLPLGRTVARSVESFQSDETFEEEQKRRRIEAERKRIEALNAGRGVAA